MAYRLSQMDCENQNIVIENLPPNAAIVAMQRNFNGVVVSPQPILTASLNTYLGEDTYVVIIIFQLTRRLEGHTKFARSY